MCRQSSLLSYLPNKKSLFLLISLLNHTYLSASGFAIKENSASLLGEAFASASTWTQDISGMRTNPALIGKFNNKKETILGISYVMPRIHMHDITGTPPKIALEENNLSTLSNISNATHSIGIPDSFTSIPVNNKIVLGLAITSPWGLSTQYPNHWPGEYHAIKTELKTYNVNPIIAYNYSSQLTLAAGLQVQLMQANLIQSFLTTTPEKPANTNVKGDNIALGASFGILYAINSRNKLGIGYQSSISQDLKGEMTLNPSVPFPEKSNVQTNITTPNTLNIGFAHIINSKWDINTNVEWTNWHRFQKMTIITDQISIVFNENWHNTFYYALGSNYHYNSKLDLRAGLAYDESPVPDSTRSPRTPDNNRLWTSLGLGYQFSNTMHFNLGYTHIFMKNSVIDLETGIGGHLITSNNTNADIFSSSVTWIF